MGCIIGIVEDKIFRTPGFHQFFGSPIGCLCDCHMQELEVELANAESALAILEAVTEQRGEKE